MGQVGNYVVVGLLTLASGLLDARGFVYAARAWPQGQLDVKMGLAALLSFVGGLTAYILAIRSCRTPGSTGRAAKRNLVRHHRRRDRRHGRRRSCNGPAPSRPWAWPWRSRCAG